MQKGDLVRIRTLQATQFRFGFLDEDPIEEIWGEVGIVIEYNSWEKMATVLIQSTGKRARIQARDLELVRRAPYNKERLAMLAKLKDFPYQLYCDMDGVLVDFEGAATRDIRKALRSPPEGLESLCESVLNTYGYDIDITAIKETKTPRTPELRELVARLFEEDVQWWADLPFLEEGKKLWAIISRLECPINILTSPMDQNGFHASEEGKKLWVKKNLNELGTIRWEERIIFSHNKFEYARDCDQPAVLIDDFPKKVDPFNLNGGYGILHKGNAKETLQQLEAICNGEADMGADVGMDS